jgi:hypothetical protein
MFPFLATRSQKRKRKKEWELTRIELVTYRKLLRVKEPAISERYSIDANLGFRDLVREQQTVALPLSYNSIFDL